MSTTAKALRTLNNDEKMSEEQKQAVKKTCRKIIGECLKEVAETDRVKQKIEQGYKEIDMKEDQFEEVFNILKDLENTETHAIELMFLMKMNDREELLREAKKVTKDFRSGALDPNSKNQRFEQQMKKKKDKAERLKRKLADRVQFDETMI